ncbi:ribonuclease P protein component [Pseudemcibacter aquimaris]|uniref:ribonuclease P protein component n=1 Tax=Pseudemcibacter aquimaris TaxID=2857064 RepID=UPI0020111525|nr:ribonuclease P protein component [Pseudemcibacter aquimaris]MCC3861415.1 ribonuclease P protein component [Pseudemcibacter aquimaris]WDU58185.1 ribonuclease P protein component [Pseudemcibacter aquimaris]
MTDVIENKGKKLPTLKKRSEFLSVASTRQKWITPAFIIQLGKNENDEPRIGYTASKKVGNAVARSRAKRRMREVVRNVAGACLFKNRDYVFIARQEILTYPFDQLIRDAKWALKRLDGLKQKKKEGA